MWTHALLVWRNLFFEQLFNMKFTEPASHLPVQCIPAVALVSTQSCLTTITACIWWYLILQEEFPLCRTCPLPSPIHETVAIFDEMCPLTLVRPQVITSVFKCLKCVSDTGLTPQNTSSISHGPSATCFTPSRWEEGPFPHPFSFREDMKTSTTVFKEALLVQLRYAGCVGLGAIQPVLSLFGNLLQGIPSYKSC